MPDLLEGLETPLEDIDEGLPEGDGSAPAPLEGAEETPEGEKPPVPTSLFQSDGKKLDPAIKTVLGELKTKSPEAARLVTKALYDMGQFQREFPGGLTEAKEIRDKIDGLGGFTAIEERLQDLDFFDGVDKKFTAGDPGFVDELANADPGAFAKIAPAVFAKYADIHPDGWKQYIGSVVYGDLLENGIPAEVTRLADALNAKNDAVVIDSFNKIAKYLMLFKGLKELRPELPKGKTTETPDGDLNKREMALRSREWQAEYAQLERRIVQDEYRSAIGSRKPTSEERATIQELYLNRRQTLARQYFPDQGKKLEQMRLRNDKAGFMRLARIMQLKVTPEAMRWAVARTLKPAKSSTTRQNTQQEQRTESQRKPQSQANGAGIFKFVGAEPDTYDIDYDKTNKALLAENKAILRDGSRVQWREGR